MKGLEEREVGDNASRISFKKSPNDFYKDDCLGLERRPSSQFLRHEAIGEITETKAKRFLRSLPPSMCYFLNVRG